MAPLEIDCQPGIHSTCLPSFLVSHSTLSSLLSPSLFTPLAFLLPSLYSLSSHTQLPLLLGNCVVHSRIHCAAGRPPFSPFLLLPLPPHQLDQLFYSSLPFSDSLATSFATAVILCEVFIPCRKRREGE